MLPQYTVITAISAQNNIALDACVHLSALMRMSLAK